LNRKFQIIQQQQEFITETITPQLSQIKKKKLSEEKTPSHPNNEKEFIQRIITELGYARQELVDAICNEQKI